MPDIFLVLFVTSVLPIALSAVGIYFRVSELGKFDNGHPRAQLAALTGPGARIAAAQKNAWEALSFFCVVTLIAVASPIDLNALTLPAYLFLLARIFHPIMYVANLSILRSLIFALGWFSCLYIFLVSLNAYST